MPEHRQNRLQGKPWWEIARMHFVGEPTEARIDAPVGGSSQGAGVRSVLCTSLAAHRTERKKDTPMMLDGVEFLEALATGLGAEERLITCGFAGDPNTAPANAWRPRPWAPGKDLGLERSWNGYVTVASFGRAKDTSFRRRTDCFSAGLALMVDDVGTKVDPAVVMGMPASAIVETSPGNCQWWYFLDRPERDKEKFDGVIRSFIYGQLLGNDPGMNGVNRVGRIPGFVNGKPKNNGWLCVLRELNARRWSMQELIAGFKLKPEGRRYAAPAMRSETALERAHLWKANMGMLKAMRMLKKFEPDPSGWTEMHCPWSEGHTDRADTGAAVRVPHLENGWYGGFRCHHGSCAERGWQELTGWVADAAGDMLEGINGSSAAEAFEAVLTRQSGAAR